MLDALAGSEQAARWHVYGKHYWFPRCNAAGSLIRLGRWDEAGTILAAGEALTEGVSEVYVHSMSSLLAVLSGRFDDAGRHLELVFSKSVEIVDPQFQGPIHWVAAMKAWFEGKLETAWGLIEKGLDLVEKGEDWFYRAPLHVLGAAILADLALAGDDPARRRSAVGVLVRDMQAATNEASAADFPGQLAQTEAELTRAEGASDPSAWEKARLFVAGPSPALRCRLLPIPPWERSCSTPDGSRRVSPSSTRRGRCRQAGRTALEPHDRTSPPRLGNPVLARAMGPDPGSSRQAGSSAVDAEAVASDDVPVPVEAVLRGPDEGLLVDVDQPEPLGKTGQPFEVVEKAPMEVAVDGNSFVDCLLQGGQMGPDVIDPPRVMDRTVLTRGRRNMKLRSR